MFTGNLAAYGEFWSRINLHVAITLSARHLPSWLGAPSPLSFSLDSQSCWWSLYELLSVTWWLSRPSWKNMRQLVTIFSRWNQLNSSSNLTWQVMILFNKRVLKQKPVYVCWTEGIHIITNTKDQLSLQPVPSQSQQICCAPPKGLPAAPRTRPQSSQWQLKHSAPADPFSWLKLAQT